MNLMNKKVVVLGIGKSGIAAGRLCKSLGAQVTLYDGKSRKEIQKEADALEQEGFQLIFQDFVYEEWKRQDLIVMSPGVPTDLPFLQESRKLHIPIWGEMELAYRYCHLPLIGITGTNGKTTTTTLVGEIFKKTMVPTYVVGNIGTPFSERVLGMAQEGYVIAEVSSFQLETIHSFHPKVSAVLNITPDHLNRHKTFEQYIQAKEKIFMNQNRGDFLILNGDDEYCISMGKKTKAKTIFFSMKKILDEGVYTKNNEIIIRWKDDEISLCSIKDLKMVGDHNVQNVMAATAIALCMGVTISLIREVILSFQGVEHRIEYVSTINNVLYYNDSKGTNPDAAIQAIQSMERPIVLIGGGMDKGTDFTEWIRFFKGKVKHLILLGETAKKIEDTAKQEGFSSITQVMDMKEAVELAYKIAHSGDCVLLSPACASWDMYSSYEERGKIFKQAVANLKEGEDEKAKKESSSFSEYTPM